MKWRPEIPERGNYTIRYEGTPPEKYCLIVNGKGHLISPLLKETIIPAIPLEKGTENRIILRRQDLSDPHKGIETEDIKIIIK